MFLIYNNYKGINLLKWGPPQPIARKTRRTLSSLSCPTNGLVTSQPRLRSSTQASRSLPQRLPSWHRPVSRQTLFRNAIREAGLANSHVDPLLAAPGERQWKRYSQMQACPRHLCHQKMGPRVASTCPSLHKSSHLAIRQHVLLSPRLVSAHSFLFISGPPLLLWCSASLF